MTLVSVVIPTFNRLHNLQRVLGALEKQDFPLDRVQVVVVSDGSTDGTHEYLHNLQTPLQLTFVAQINSGPAAARNNGIAHSKGEYVLFIDDDVVPTPSFLHEHMRLHQETPNLVVLGPMLSPSDFAYSPWVAWEQAMLLKQYASMEAGEWEPTARQFYTGNTSLAREILIKSGGFDERFRRAEDVELAYRIDKQQVRFVFNAKAIGYHYADRSFASWMATPYAYGRNDVVFAREDQAWMLGFIRRDFRTRNIASRLAVWLGLDHPYMSHAIQSVFKYLGDQSYKWNKKISAGAYSLIFNVRYYQGVSDELGGRALFFAKGEMPQDPSAAINKTHESKTS